MTDFSEGVTNAIKVSVACCDSTSHLVRNCPAVGLQHYFFGHLCLFLIPALTQVTVPASPSDGLVPIYDFLSFEIIFLQRAVRQFYSKRVVDE